MRTTVFLLLAICSMFYRASGHGRLIQPPSRSSAWRVGFATPRNYDDNALFCGGFSTKQLNGGKCGVCGDPWNGVRANEAGGRFATGKIVANYTMGQVIDIGVDITANHFGWMEYRICPNNDVTKPVTHECLNKHVLQRADGKGTKTMVNTRDTGRWTMQYKLPDGMTCWQCVLQWKYHAGNSWGVDKDTGKACIGCGDQEEFYGCADIGIMDESGLPPPTIRKPTPPRVTQQKVTRPPVVVTQKPIVFVPQTDKPPVQNPVTTPREFIGMKLPCKGINNWANDPAMDQWCTNSCAIGNCPVYGCDCSGSVQAVTEKTTTTTRRTTTTSPTTSSTTTTTTTTPKPTTTSTTTTRKPTDLVTQVVSRVECKAIHLWAGNEYLDRWCADSCARGNCPPDSCQCSVVQKVVTKTTEAILLPETTPPGGQMTKVCKAISLWKGIAVFDIWCTDECNRGNCPEDTCQCTDSVLGPLPQEQTTPQTTTTTTPKPAVTSLGKCLSNGVVDGVYWNGWCQTNCDRGYCPLDYCLCNQ